MKRAAENQSEYSCNTVIIVQTAAVVFTSDWVGRDVEVSTLWPVYSMIDVFKNVTGNETGI